MTGITGLYRLDGQPVDHCLLLRMLGKLPSGEGDADRIWAKGPVGLGHRTCRGSYDPSECQLLESRDGAICVAADARVDNRPELLKELDSRGSPPREGGDAEIILRCYEVWNTECPARIVGDYAFALWDAARRRLFCARDPLGIKPFFYSSTGNSLLLASSCESILRHPDVSRTPNLELITNYLLTVAGHPAQSLYEQIHRLPPGHSLVVEQGTLQVSRHWEIDPDRTIRYSTIGEYADHFREHFREAVRARMVCGEGVGAWLSGGHDSSSIVSMAAALSEEGVAPRRPDTFSIVFDEHPCDESRYIQDVVRRWNLPAHQVTYEREGRWVDFERAGEHPSVLYSPSLFANAPLLQTARQEGIGVLLDGVGGDDLLEAGGAGPSLAPWSHRVSAALPLPLRTLLRRGKRGFRPKPGAAWLTATALGLVERREANGEKIFASPHKQRIHQRLTHGWNANVAIDMAGAFRAAHGVETRYPFLDVRLVEFLMALPDDCWSTDRGPKPLLRRAMKELLPVSVWQRRDKADFTSLIDGELKFRQVSKVKELLRDSRLAALGVVEPAPLRRMFQQYRALETPDPSTRRTLQMTLALELWCCANEAVRVTP